MKKCICIVTHTKTDENVTSIFKKNRSYDYFLTITHILVISDSYLDRCGNKLEKSYFYTIEQFEKYFTTDIKVIRKMKLDKIKKVVQI